MKAVILAGGLGTRLNEETKDMPKPMVRIGGKPILLHIMNLYSVYGINDFIICCGYKGYVIKEYFNNYFLHNSDIEMELDGGMIKHKNISNNNNNNWKILFADTGEETMTGGRIKKIKKYIKNDDTFFMTYGDGVSNVNIKKLLEFHKKHKKIATVTAVRPPARFGELTLIKNKVLNFDEKNQIKTGWINGGFFVFNSSIFKFIPKKNTMLERDTMRKLTHKKQILAFKHEGFWQCMDTLRDKELLDKRWKIKKNLW